MAREVSFPFFMQDIQVSQVQKLKELKKLKKLKELKKLSLPTVVREVKRQ